MDSFEKEFEDWLEKSLAANISDEVKGFSFNLDESGNKEGYEFGVELIGADRFDLNDENWACYEIWEPARRSIFIPLSYSGETWEECLENIKNLAIKFFASNTKAAQTLKSREGVGIGFVDGNLEVIWSKEVSTG